MIHLKYKSKVNFVKLPLIWIYLCLKLIFENATAGRKHRLPLSCEPPGEYQPTPPPKCRDNGSDYASWVRPASCNRGSHEGVYGN